MIISKPGKTKEQLLKCLKNLKSKFAKEISEYEIEIMDIENGYRISGEKKVLFINFSVDVKITAEDGKYDINYTTKNVPESKINEAIEMIKEELGKC